MGRWVLLRHELGDGSWHYDWMIQADGVGVGGADRGVEAGLITFRVGQRPDEAGGAGVVAFRAERIGVHRAAYLSFEGEVSGGRGRVRRVGQGEATIHADGEAFVVTLAGIGTWVGTRIGGVAEGDTGGMYEFRLSDGGEFGHTG